MYAQDPGTVLGSLIPFRFCIDSSGECISRQQERTTGFVGGAWSCCSGPGEK